MRLLAQAAEQIVSTTKKTQKIAYAAEYLRTRSVDEAAASALFLSGRVFAAYEEATLNLGGALLWRAVAEVSGKGDVALTAAYRRHGDLGAAAYDVLVDRAPAAGTLGVLEVRDELARVAAASGNAEKLRIATELLRRATALEAKYIVKIILGDLRIGFRESLVEEAVAQAYSAPIEGVRRANMLLGDIAETLRLAAAGRLGEARMRLFHPIGFMLASPADTAAEAFDYFQNASVEDKYDGIRAQAHCGGAEHAYRVRLFSRTLDEITAHFPELPPALRMFPEPVILDGEIVAWDATSKSAEHPTGRALPFSALQKRLGRKRVSPQLMEDVPVVFLVFDVLFAGGELVIERPLRERMRLLDGIFANVSKPEGYGTAGIQTAEVGVEDPQGRLVFEPAVAEQDGNEWPRVLRAPALRAGSADELNILFDAARRRGNEGLMIKDLESPYVPGRRGKSWLKLKRELATLDVVVTRAEYGHGKRAGVLSDVTFAVRNGDELVNVGKAYSGLTDAEIAELTRWFEGHTLVDEGFARIVEPRIVLEVAFNNMMRSQRHNSGFALRFPRIVRIRTDKSPADIDTLQRVREIYDSQKLAA